jgi:hypothetical protein
VERGKRKEERGKRKVEGGKINKKCTRVLVHFVF